MGEMHCYYSEMGGKPDESRIFRSTHVFRSTYAIMWSVGDDAKAREIFKALRVRPSRIRREVAGRDFFPKNGQDRWSAQVTHNAHEKLASHVTHELLLD